jgi:diacylglycerol O-acyltransferase
MVVPFTAPLSVLNGRVREKRRFATQQFAMERLRNLAKAAECTLNDVVLAICGGALRRFLEERDGLPDKSLTTGIPVSVRPARTTKAAATPSPSSSPRWAPTSPMRGPSAWLQSANRCATPRSTCRACPSQAMMQYTVLLMAPTILTLLTGIGGRTRPMFNITISNVPGPDKPLYFRGAELVAIYPASIVTHGQALNITCESYAGPMNFGFTGCHCLAAEHAAAGGLCGGCAGGAGSGDLFRHAP